MPRDRARSTTETADEQARGTARNVRALGRRWQLDDFLPNAFTSLFQELIALLAYAAGRGSAYRQIAASVTLIIFAIMLTPFTLGWSLALAIPFVVTLIIGFVRLIPGINAYYRDLRGSKLRDRDIPRWRRD